MPPKVPTRWHNPQSESTQGGGPPSNGGSANEQASRQHGRCVSPPAPTSYIRVQQPAPRQPIGGRQAFPFATPMNSPSNSSLSLNQMNVPNPNQSGTVTGGMMNPPPPPGFGQAQPPGNGQAMADTQMTDTQMMDVIVHPTHSNEAQARSITQEMERMNLDSQTQNQTQDRR